MRNKKILRVSLFMFLLISISWSVFAAEVVNIDLKTAINTVLKSDLDYEIATITYDKARLDYEKKKASYLLQQSRYNELEMESSLDSAEYTYQNTKFQLVNNIISEYSKLWLSNLDLEIKNKNMELETLRLEESKAQYEIGDIGSIDLLDQENSYKDAQYNLENARDDYRYSIKEFKTDLQLGDAEEVELARLKYTKDWQITENEAVDIAMKNSVEIRQKRDQLELAQIDLERAGVSAAELDKQIKAKNVQIAELELEKERKKVERSTQEAHYQFRQSIKKIALNAERLTGAEEKFNLRKEQYEVGLITSIEVLEYEINKLQARYNYLSVIADYYQKEQALRQQMGLGAGVFSNENTGDK